MITLTEEQKEVIQKLNHPLYTVEYLQAQEWVDFDRNDNIFVNTPMAFKATAASGYLAAVDSIIQNRPKSSYKFYWEDSPQTGIHYFCVERDGEVISKDIYVDDAEFRCSKVSSGLVNKIKNKYNGHKFGLGLRFGGNIYYNEKLLSNNLEDAKRDMLSWYVMYLKNKSESIFKSAQQATELYLSLKDFVDHL